jgi:hypothetical protein
LRLRFCSFEHEENQRVGLQPSANFLSRTLNQLIAQFIIKKIGARDLILSRKSAVEVVPAAKGLLKLS